MRKIAVLALVVLALGAKPASAACRLGPCPPLVQAIGWTFAAGIAGGYGYGMGYLIYHDATDDHQSLNYGVGEFTVNALGLALTGGGTIAAIKDGSEGTAAVLLPMAALHGTLMVHGGWRMYQERDGFRVPMGAKLFVGGSVFIANGMIWSSQWGERHGRGFGIAETAVNAPIAVGLGYLAYDRFTSWHGGAGFLYGGMAAVHAAFAIHGLHTAISPAPPLIDVNGLDLTPTIVDDGKQSGFGLGLSRSW